MPKRHSKSSRRWLTEHFDDVWVKKAQKEGWRSRAAYKLIEMNDKNKLLKPNTVVVDLGAAPGGWTQYVTRKLDGQGTVIALDCLPMDGMPGAICIEGDFTEDAVLAELMTTLDGKGVDLVLSDMAPNMSGTKVVDQPRAMYLAELALDFAQQTLNPGGSFVIKLFHGAGFDVYVKQARTMFKRVTIRKPEASRARSPEVYLVGQGYNAA